MPLAGALAASRIYAGLLAQAASSSSGGDGLLDGELYGTVLDSLVDGIAVADRHGEIIGCNDAWRAANTGHLGLGGGIAVGSDYLEALRRAAEWRADAAAVLDGVERVLSGRLSSFLFEYSSVREGCERWFAIRVTPLQRVEGGLVVVHQDITEKRLAERDRDLHRAKLNRVGRVAGLDEMSGAIAHELNQPLTAILTNAEVGLAAAMRDGANGELLAILQDIANDTRRASEVIKRVRGLLRHGESDFGPVQLNRIVSDVLSLCGSDISLHGVSVSTSFDPRLPLLHGDAIELQQLLLNLATNACEAMAETECGKRELHIATAVRDDGCVELCVSDTGKGFSGIRPERLVEPFFTTKERGLGLGLTICGAIVQAHGGTMKLASRDHGGARVTVDFPVPAAE